MATAEQHHILDLPVFAEPVKLAIVVSPYYKDIAAGLIAGAQAKAKGCDAKVELIEVPGALEIPPAIRIAHRRADFDGFVALGCVIRGETTHYETVCNDSSHGLMLLGLQGVNLGNGILTVENRAQAEIRCDPKGYDAGGGAAAAALHLIALERKYGSSGKGIGFGRPLDEDDGSFQIA